MIHYIFLSRHVVIWSNHSEIQKIITQQGREKFVYDITGFLKL